MCRFKVSFLQFPKLRRQSNLYKHIFRNFFCLKSVGKSEGLNPDSLSAEIKLLNINNLSKYYFTRIIFTLCVHNCFYIKFSLCSILEITNEMLIKTNITKQEINDGFIKWNPLLRISTIEMNKAL